MLYTNICTTRTHTHTCVYIYIYMGIRREYSRCTHILYSILTYMDNAHIRILYVTRMRWKVKTENRFLEEMTSTNILLSYYVAVVLFVTLDWCVACALRYCVPVPPWWVCVYVCARSTVVVAKNNRVTPKEYRVFRPISSFQ